ncbi:MAG: DUF2127 domain-containing protein [bacterium]|nr:DUF2127 domain-containing protein [Candidatus Jorgensenbacteria bacterium]
MRKFFRKHSYQLFKAGIFIKAGIAIAEIIVGVAFYFLSYETMNAILTSVLQIVVKNPESGIWSMVNSGFRDLIIYSTSFWAFIFLSHGITKILLTRGLLKNKAWAYIASLVVFSYFIINQIYQTLQHPSFALELITVFDIIVVYLIFYEYRRSISRRKSEDVSLQQN